MARKRHTAEETVVTEVTSLFYGLGNFRAKTLKLCASIPGSLGMVAKISDKFSVCREFRPGDWSDRTLRRQPTRPVSGAQVARLSAETVASSHKTRLRNSCHSDQLSAGLLV